MFVIYDQDKQRVPIKAWLQNVSDIEDSCLKQAMNLSNLPFVFKHVVLAPDTHAGYGMPIGGIVALKGVVSPHMVGNDIGCGMGFIPIGVPAQLLREVKTSNGPLGQAIVSCIMRNIPTGMNRHKTPLESNTINKCLEEFDDTTYVSDLVDELEDAPYYLKTLGGGKHDCLRAA